MTFEKLRGHSLLRTILFAEPDAFLSHLFGRVLPRAAGHAPPARPCVGRQLSEGDPEAGPAPGARGLNSGAESAPYAWRAFTREGPARQRALRRCYAPPAAMHAPGHAALRRRLRARRRTIPAERRAAASAASVPERTRQALRRARNVRPASPRSCALTL